MLLMLRMKAIPALIAAAALAACAERDHSSEEGVSADGSLAVVSHEPSEEAEEAADAAAAQAVEGTTYADQGAPYGCTHDCSGHEAGYAWAEENDVTEPLDCSGNSQSFIEGCEARAEAYQEARREALEEAGEEAED